MKYSMLSGLIKHLHEARDNGFSSVYTLLGKEEFARKQAVEEVLQALLKGKSRELCLKNFEGETVSPPQLMHELSSSSFFSEQIVVVVQQADKLKKAVVERLLPYLAQPNPGVYLILSAANLPANTQLYKALEKQGIILLLGQEKPWEKEKSLGEWARAKFDAGGKKISSALCLTLVKQMGLDQALLDKEIEKIICYCGERKEVLAEDLAAIGSYKGNENSWQLGEAILRLDAAAASRLAIELLVAGEMHLLQVIAALRRQIETSFQVCSILVSKGSREEITRTFPYMQGNILERHIQLAQGYGISRFKRAMMLLQEMETRSKNSQGEAELLAMQLVAKLT